MKKTALFGVAIVLMLSFSAHAVIFNVLGKKGENLLSSETQLDLTKSLGAISVEILNQNQIPFTGADYGLTVIFGLGQDLEIISNSEMKAYGWCFSIDGVVPETFADQTFITDQSSIIIWYYAYAHYKEGVWIGQCIMANSL